MMGPIAAHPNRVPVGTVPTVLVAVRGRSVADDSVAVMPVMIVTVVVPSAMIVANGMGLNIEAGMG